MIDWSAAFEKSLPYNAFLDRYGKPNEITRWEATHARVSLTSAQLELIRGFKRHMPIICLAGTWCGDCVDQCPILDHIARVNPSVLDLRFLDRDADTAISGALSVNGGHRVPNVLFLSEDFQEVARFGDRTLVRYRQLAEQQLGAACPTGLVPASTEMLTAVTDEWLGHFERAQLMLRLSPRLRQKHND